MANLSQEFRYFLNKPSFSGLVEMLQDINHEHFLSQSPTLPLSQSPTPPRQGSFDDESMGLQRKNLSFSQHR